MPFYIVYYHKGFYCKRSHESLCLQTAILWMERSFPGCEILLIRYNGEIVFENLGDLTLRNIGEE